MYLVGFSCFYQGKITQKGAEWSEEERERVRKRGNKREISGKQKKREGITGRKNLAK